MVRQPVESPCSGERRRNRLAGLHQVVLLQSVAVLENGRKASSLSAASQRIARRVILARMEELNWLI